MRPLLRRLWAAWHRLAYRIAVINGIVILALFYLLVMTPYALVLRLLRQDLLDRRRERGRPSYWHLRKRRALGPADAYRRPF